MEILVNSKKMGNLIIKEISKDLAKKIMVENHYAHKWNAPFGIINIGIFKECDENKCLGACVYGYMMNPNSYSNYGVEKDEILELNRMWIDDELGHNAETILISNSFKIIKKKMPHIKLIQSFADGRLGCGTIYKASNFKYYGYSTATFYDDLTTGEIAKDTLLNDTRSLKTMIEENEKLLDGQLKFFKVKSYRYIYSLRKGAFKGVKFKEKEYPTYQKGKEYFERPIKINEIIRCYIGCFIYNKNDVVYKFENLLKENKVDIDEIFNILETNKTILKLINKENNSIENLKKIILNRYKINN